MKSDCRVVGVADDSNSERRLGASKPASPAGPFAQAAPLSVQSGLQLGSAPPRLPPGVQCWPPEALSGSRAGLGKVGRVS